MPTKFARIVAISISVGVDIWWRWCLRLCDKDMITPKIGTSKNRLILEANVPEILLL